MCPIWLVTAIIRYNEHGQSSALIRGTLYSDPAVNELFYWCFTACTCSNSLPLCEEDTVFSTFGITCAAQSCCVSCPAYAHCVMRGNSFDHAIDSFQSHCRVIQLQHLSLVIIIWRVCITSVSNLQPTCLPLSLWEAADSLRWVAELI